MCAFACSCAGLQNCPRCCSCAVQRRSQRAARRTVAASTRAAGAQKRYCRPCCCHIAPPLRPLVTDTQAEQAVSRIWLEALQLALASLLPAAPPPSVVLQPPHFVLLGAWKLAVAAARADGAAGFRAAHCGVRPTAPPREQAAAAGPLQPTMLLRVLRGAAQVLAHSPDSGCCKPGGSKITT